MSEFTKKGFCSFDKNGCVTQNCTRGNHRNPKSNSYIPSTIDAVKPSEEVLICQVVGSKPPLNTGAMSNAKVGGGSPQEKTQCRFFNTAKGCKFGPECRNLHEPKPQSLETDGSESEEEIEDTPFEHFLETIIFQSGCQWKITYEDDRKFASYCELFSKFNAEQQRLLIVLILDNGLGKALLEEDAYLSSKVLPPYFDFREYDNEVTNDFQEWRRTTKRVAMAFYSYKESCEKAFAKATINLSEEEAELVKIFADEYHMYLNTWCWEEDGDEDNDE